MLDIQKSVTLVDARNLSNPKYTTHDTFNQQIDIADIIVGNKSDLYRGGEKERLEQYVSTRKEQKVSILYTHHGNLEPSILKGPSGVARSLRRSVQHSHPSQASNVDNAIIPECGYLGIENNGEGYRSIGWRFSPDKVFNREALYTWLNGIEAERMKAVFITDEGVFGYNLTPDALTEIALDDCLESRLEIIAEQIDPQWKVSILQLAGIQ